MRNYDEMLAILRLGGRTDFGGRPVNLNVRRFQHGDARLVEYAGGYFLVWDNGGEVGVERLNSPQAPRFFPLTTVNGGVDPGTLYRMLLSCLRGEEIDWTPTAPWSLVDML